MVQVTKRSYTTASVLLYCFSSISCHQMSLFKYRKPVEEMGTLTITLDLRNTISFLVLCISYHQKYFRFHQKMKEGTSPKKVVPDPGKIRPIFFCKNSMRKNLLKVSSSLEN